MACCLRAQELACHLNSGLVRYLKVQEPAYHLSEAWPVTSGLRELACHLSGGLAVTPLRRCWLSALFDFHDQDGAVVLGRGGMFADALQQVAADPVGGVVEDLGGGFHDAL